MKLIPIQNGYYDEMKIENLPIGLLRGYNFIFKIWNIFLKLLQNKFLIFVEMHVNLST